MVLLAQQVKLGLRALRVLVVLMVWMVLLELLVQLEIQVLLVYKAQLEF
jgi:hypothetical protein